MSKKLHELLKEYEDTYEITEDDELLAEEGENYIYGRLESLATELIELVGEGEAERLIGIIELTNNPNLIRVIK